MLGGAASAVAAVLGMTSAPALAIRPISEWKIEPSDVRCVAVRKYGTADKPLTLALKAPPIGNANNWPSFATATAIRRVRSMRPLR